MKNILVKFKNPLDWKVAENLDFGDLLNVTFIASGGSADIVACKTTKKNLPKLTASLKKNKIAFSVK